MKEHESRLLLENETYFKFQDGKFMEFTYNYNINFVPTIFVDSNNFVHNIEGENYTDKNNIISGFYYIHGIEFTKEDWLEKRNEILLEQHRKEILEEIFV